MTVDSAYFAEQKERDEDTEFPFEIESIGDEAMRVYLIKDGVRYRLTFGYPDP
jgi:hypothetical protein